MRSSLGHVGRLVSVLVNTQVGQLVAQCLVGVASRASVGEVPELLELSVVVVGLIVEVGGQVEESTSVVVGAVHSLLGGLASAVDGVEDEGSGAGQEFPRSLEVFEDCCPSSVVDSSIPAVTPTLLDQVLVSSTGRLLVEVGVRNSEDSLALWVFHSL